MITVVETEDIISVLYIYNFYVSDLLSVTQIWILMLNSYPYSVDRGGTKYVHTYIFFTAGDGNDLGLGEDGFPWWASRKLVQSFETSQTDAIVAQDGSGNRRTIAEAMAAAPENNTNRYAIRIRGGMCRENIQVTYHKPNIMFVGDGIHATVITGARNTADGYSTVKTATVGMLLLYLLMVCIC